MGLLTVTLPRKLKFQQFPVANMAPWEIPCVLFFPFGNSNEAANPRIKMDFKEHPTHSNPMAAAPFAHGHSFIL